jgi:hypothetical protein
MFVKTYFSQHLNAKIISSLSLHIFYDSIPNQACVLIPDPKSFWSILIRILINLYKFLKASNSRGPKKAQTHIFNIFILLLIFVALYSNRAKFATVMVDEVPLWCSRPFLKSNFNLVGILHLARIGMLKVSTELTSLVNNQMFTTKMITLHCNLMRTFIFL